MTKGLIIGLATIAVSSAALLGTGMYAAIDSTTSISNTTPMNHMRGGNPEDLAATLSGKVSTEAITAFQALMTKHKTEMDAMRSNTGVTIDKSTAEKKREEFKTEMDALMSKYPDLKSALPSMGKGEMNGRGNGEIESILSTLPSEVQTQLKSIRDEYQSKEEALKNEEKTKIDAILAQYPEVKTKLDAINTNGPQGMGEKGRHGREKGMKSNSFTQSNN